MAQQYESGQKSYWYENNADGFSTGKIATEHAFSILEAKGYIERDSDGDFVISAKGKNEILFR